MTRTQCRVKVKKLQNASHKVREANHHSGAAPTTCRFYKELDEILGGDPASTPKSTMDTSEAAAAHSSTRQEEESGSEGAEEEGSPEPEDSLASLDACSQELFSSQEEGSQSQRMVLGEEQTAEEVPGCNLEISAFLVINRQKAAKNQEASAKKQGGPCQQSLTENQKVHEWRETERRLCQQNADRRHQSTERLLSIMEHQVDSMQVLIALQTEQICTPSPPPTALVPKLFPLCPHVTANPLPPASSFL